MEAYYDDGVVRFFCKESHNASMVFIPHLEDNFSGIVTRDTLERTDSFISSTRDNISNACAALRTTMAYTKSNLEGHPVWHEHMADFLSSFYYDFDSDDRSIEDVQGLLVNAGLPVSPHFCLIASGLSEVSGVGRHLRWSRVLKHIGVYPAYNVNNPVAINDIHQFIKVSKTLQ